MTKFSTARLKSLAVRTAIAAAAVAACSAASAATFDPTVLGVSAPSFTFDTIGVYDFAKVTAMGSMFSESGLLSFNSFSDAGTTFSPAGFNSTYGIYIDFTASGSGGLLTSLNYNVYGYTGTSTFSVTEAGGATRAGSTGVLLGGGSLTPASNTYGGDGVNFAYLVANGLSFGGVAGFSSLSGATASFTNDSSNLTPFTNGFLTVKGSQVGGGTIHLITAAVPEPETYALMLGGLAAVGFVARRRSNG